MANDKKKLTQNEEIRVRAIALMCPEEAGKAPFKARSLYLMVTTEPLPDWSNCKNTVQIRQSANASNMGLAIYPNPAKNNVTVSLGEPLSIESSYEWQIVDITGKILKTGKFSSNIETINTQDLNTGIYMIRIEKDKAIIRIEKFTIICTPVQTKSKSHCLLL